MNHYQQIYLEKSNYNEAILLNKVKESKSWEDLYWISLILYNSEMNCDEIIIDSLERSFDYGLTIKTNDELYLNAIQLIAKLYFTYGMYSQANNKLMILVASLDTIPDWVHLYYATSQIHTSNIYRIIEEPDYFFERLEKIDCNNKNSLNRRRAIYQEFLDVLTKMKSDISLQGCSIESIAHKAFVYGVECSNEFRTFVETYELDIKLPIEEIEEIITVDSDELEEKNEILNRQLGEVQSAFDAKVNELEEANKKLTLLQEKIDEVQRSKAKDENIIEKLTNELKEAQITLQNVTMQLVEYQKQLKEKEQEVQEAKVKIEELQEKAVKNEPNAVKYEGELLTGRKKILVLGATQTKDLYGIAKAYAGLKKENIEFFLDYDKMDTLGRRIQPYLSPYVGIIVGPCPHKVAKSDGYSSFIQKLKEEPGYPHVVEARDSCGELKITKTSFKKCLDEMMRHLQSIN